MNQDTATKILSTTWPNWGLSGPHNGKLRQSILFGITGKKPPLAKSGVHELWNAIHADLRTPDGSDAAMREWASQRMREIANGSTIAQDAPGGGGGHNRSTDTAKAILERQARSANGL